MTVMRNRTRRREHDDFFDTPLSGEDFALVTEGEQDAVIVALKKGLRFQRLTIDFTWRIVLGPDTDVCIPGYGHLRKDGSMAPGSNLARWRQMVATFSGYTPSHVTLNQFKHYWFKVKAKTCTRDQDQQPLHPSCYYSKVVDILAVVGKLAELPSSETRSKEIRS